MEQPAKEQTIESLINALSAQVWRTRTEAADALIQLGKPAVLPLIDAICNAQFGYHYLPEAVRALGGIGDPRAIEPLINVFRHDWNDTETFTAWQKASAALAAIGEPSLGALLNALSDEDDTVRQGVIEALGKLRDPRAVDPLIKALQDETSIVRGRAAAALAQIGDDHAIGPLTALLADAEWSVRVRAISALGQLGSQSVFALLVDALKDQEPRVRNAIVLVLGKLQDERLVDILLDVLSDPDGRVRAAAASMLGQRGDERALPALYWMQQNDTGYAGANKVSASAVRAIQSIQERCQKR